MSSITHLRSLREARRAIESQRHTSAHPCSIDPRPLLALLALQQVSSLPTTLLLTCLEKSFALTCVRLEYLIHCQPNGHACNVLIKVRLQTEGRSALGGAICLWPTLHVA